MATLGGVAAAAMFLGGCALSALARATDRASVTAATALMAARTTAATVRTMGTRCDRRRRLQSLRVLRRTPFLRQCLPRPVSRSVRRRKRLAGALASPAHARRALQPGVGIGGGHAGRRRWPPLGWPESKRLSENPASSLGRGGMNAARVVSNGGRESCGQSLFRAERKPARVIRLGTWGPAIWTGWRGAVYASATAAVGVFKAGCRGVTAD